MLTLIISQVGDSSAGPALELELSLDNLSMTLLLINKTRGLKAKNKLGANVITELKKNLKLNFMYNYVPVEQSEFFQELPQQL